MKRYMVAGNLRKIQKKLDNADSEINLALEMIADMNFDKLEGEDKSLTGINATIERLDNVFHDLIAIKHHFETIADEMEIKAND